MQMKTYLSHTELPLSENLKLFPGIQYPQVFPVFHLYSHNQGNCNQGNQGHNRGHTHSQHYSHHVHVLDILQKNK